MSEETRKVKVLGRVYDITKHFRIIALARADRWKTSTMLKGRFIDEQRETMGHVASTQTAQRLSFLLARFLVRDFDLEFPAALREMSLLTQRVLGAWIDMRKKTFGDIQDQSRPMKVLVLQDDFEVATITEELAAWLEGG